MDAAEGEKAGHALDVLEDSTAEFGQEPLWRAEASLTPWIPEYRQSLSEGPVYVQGLVWYPYDVGSKGLTTTIHRETCILESFLLGIISDS